MENATVIDTLWVLICTALVFFMQAGFCCLESGLCRAKNSINIAIKNMVDVCIAGALFWFFGYALMFGDSIFGWVGSSGFLFFDSSEDHWSSTIFLFQLVFCGTAITIVSGAVAGRMRFSSYLVLAALISGIVYPIVGHWAWGSVTGSDSQGWLESLGFIDFAGSTVVHGVGAWSALAAVIILGARNGRFEPGESPRIFHGSNVPMAALGVFILWFGWFGFNGGSSLALDETVPKILVNTFLAGVFGGLTALLWQALTAKVVSVESVMNGILAGLVAITAGCHIVSTMATVVIAVVAAMVMQFTSHLLEKRFQIDDVVGAIPVHGCAGAWGTIALALFAPLTAFPEGHSRWEQVLVQSIGVAACFMWAFGVSWVLLKIVNEFFPLRVSEADERIGLNIAEHGASTDLHDLFETMEEHVQGDLTARVPVEEFTEVGLIATQYNRVVDTVEAKTLEITQVNSMLTVAHEEAITAHKELEESMAELTEFNQLSIGRELRMVDLKSEVNELHSQLGQPDRYVVDEDKDGQHDHLSNSLHDNAAPTLDSKE